MVAEPVKDLERLGDFCDTVGIGAAMEGHGNVLDDDLFDTDGKGEEEDELDDLVDAVQVSSTAVAWVGLAVEAIDGVEDDGPGTPTECSVTDELDVGLDGVEVLCE